MSTYVWTGLSAKTVANYFLGLAGRDRVPIDPVKLQKLIYLAHGWSLRFLNRPLIREPFEAWRYGPMVPALYEEFKRFGASPITAFAREVPGESAYGIDPETKSLLDTVWKRYGSLSSVQLSMLLHEPGYAWELTRRRDALTPWGGPTIPNDLIAEEFVLRQQGR